jgi:hypothetical protein
MCMRVCALARALVVNRAWYKAIWKQMTVWWLWRVSYLFSTPPFGLQGIGFSLMKCLAFTKLVKHSVKPILPSIFITQNFCTLSTQSVYECHMIITVYSHYSSRHHQSVSLCYEGRHLFSRRYEIHYLLLPLWRLNSLSFVSKIAFWI